MKRVLHAHHCLSLVATLAALVLWPTSALAYRPFNSTDAAVAGQGEVEIELGPVGYLKEGSDSSLVIPSVVFNWGFADRLELVLEGRSFARLGHVPPTEARLQVAENALSLKAVLREGTLQDKTGLSIATEVGLLLPTINGEAGVGAQGTLILSQRWPDLTLHLNGTIAWTRTHALGLSGGVIFELHDAWVVRPVAELLVEGEADAPTLYSGLLGAIWRVSDNLSVDSGFRLAREGEVKSFEIRAGLTWSFDLRGPR